jgi:hypothetical protein
LWDDAMLIVCTDHGLLLGERGWWGKNVQPWYEENIHTPLFVWDPRLHVRDERRNSLVQMIDFAPTLLDFFGVQPTPDMQGRSLSGVISGDSQLRDTCLFGNHGGHVCITDGRYVYMRACVTPDNQPLEQFTLMPTHMDHRFAPAELRELSLVDSFPFTKQIPVLERFSSISKPIPNKRNLFAMKRWKRAWRASSPRPCAPIMHRPRSLSGWACPSWAPLAPNIC